MYKKIIIKLIVNDIPKDPVKQNKLIISNNKKLSDFTDNEDIFNFVSDEIEKLNQKFSGHKDKIVFYEMDGNAASKKVKDKSLDFIFIDSYCSFEQAKNDIKVWYPKVKDGGIFAGHDWNMPLVRLAVTKFRENENIKSRMSTYDDTWIWYK